MLTLVVEGGSGSELTYEFSKQMISIGASSQNDIVVRSPGVGPKHLVLQRNGDVVTFLSQSRQIVALNGERRARGVLKPGDRLRMGSATLVFKELAGASPDTSPGVTAAPEVDRKAPAPPSQGAGRKPQGAGRPRSEVLLYTEPTRLAEARSQLVDALRGTGGADLAAILRTYFARFFSGRQAALVWLDDDGCLQPIVSQEDCDYPRLPARTFSELRSQGRFALLRMGSRRLLIYPIDRGRDCMPAYLVVETADDRREDDERLLAELARLLAIFWPRLQGSATAIGSWETETRQLVEKSLPGTSQGVQVLRDGIVEAAGSPKPVLIGGQRGSGRAWTARLIAAAHPTADPTIELHQARSDGDEEFRTLIFGSPDGRELEQALAKRARGSAVVVRDVHELSLETQRELSEVIRRDLTSDYGPALRWMATTAENALELVEGGTLDTSLFSVFEDHQLTVPAFAQRREDLPLIMIRLLESAGAEQGRDIRGIELETLGALLSHPFDGQMAELLGELRRLAAATPSGEMVRGVVPAGEQTGVDSAVGHVSAASSSAALLALDDLKTVVPAVERLIIDRVLRRTLGNQSKAARQLNLSRGALIAKMKEFEIPDYRYLRRQS